MLPIFAFTSAVFLAGEPNWQSIEASLDGLLFSVLRSGNLVSEADQ